MKTAIEILSPKKPCEEAKEWMADRTPEAAWSECQCLDWMLWALESFGIAETDWRLLMRRFAQTALQYWEAPEVVRQWIDTGDEQYRSAAWSAARSAAYSAAYSAARSAAYSAAYSAAWSAAYSAARSAAYSAAYSAAESAAYSAAYSAARSTQCDIIRELFPWNRMAVLIEGAP